MITAPIELPDGLEAERRLAARLSTYGRRMLMFGLIPLLAWLALAPLSSAVIASAYVKVDLNRRPIQHRDGGIVREVRVRDGQQVSEGEPLLILGDVEIDAELQRDRHRLLAERASVARLEAEQELRDTVSFPDDLLDAGSEDRRLAEQIDKERAVFDARRRALTDQTFLLHEQRSGVEQEIGALRAQIASGAESLRLQYADLDKHRDLAANGFVPTTRVTQLEAAVADYAARVEQHRSELARAEQRMAEIDLKIAGLEGQYRRIASDELRAGSARVLDLEQELRKRADASLRQVIVAPTSGEILDLKFTTPGAVIAPRETIAEIVPIGAKLVLEARIQPQDVSRIYIDQPAEVRFDAFNNRRTPLVDGRLIYIAGDRLIDPVTNVPYFLALIETDAGSLKAAGDLTLQAGMPAEVFLRGEERTALQYLFEPLTAAMRRAGREI
jgi:HlyD family type I secretion membrane fusion protein